MINPDNIFVQIMIGVGKAIAITSALLLVLILLMGCGAELYDTAETHDERTHQGPTGETGPQGERGERGEAGKPCTVEQLEHGVKWTCSDGSTAIVNNGTDGKDGQDANEEIVPEYLGSGCGRTIVSIGDVVYLINGSSLINLMKGQWVKVSKKCTVRYKDGFIDEKEL